MIAVGVILLLVAVAACPGPPRRAGRFDDRQLHTQSLRRFPALKCHRTATRCGSIVVLILLDTSAKQPGRDSLPRVGCILAQHVTGSCLPFSLST